MDVREKLWSGTGLDFFICCFRVSGHFPDLSQAEYEEVQMNPLGPRLMCKHVSME